MDMIAKPSLMSLLVEQRVNGLVLGNGTGFIVTGPSGPQLITNRHIVTGRHHDTGQPLSKTGGLPDELVIWHNVRGKLGHWVAISEPLYADGKPLWREHPRLGVRADVVALPLTQLEHVELYPHDISNTGPQIALGPADSVSVIGFPFGLSGGGRFAIWATGFVATEPIADFDELPVILIDCRGRSGQSGSPVIAYRSGGSVAMEGGSSAIFGGPVWRFLGVYSGRINDHSDLGKVWKASAVAELLQPA